MSVTARYVVFLVLMLLYLRYRVEPHLHFEAHPEFPVFYHGLAFLKQHLAYPGGLAEYISGLLSLAIHYPWGGPVLITVLVGLICWVGDLLIAPMGNRGRVLAFVPAVLLAIAFNSLFNELTPIITLLAALLPFTLYLAAPLESDGRTIAAFLGLGIAVYYFAAGAFLYFALLVALYEFAVRRRRLPALVAFLSMETIPYLAAIYVFNLGLLEAFTRGFTWKSGAVSVRLWWLGSCYAWFPALILGWGIRQRFSERRADAAGSAPSWNRSNLGSVAETLVGLVVAIPVVMLTFDAGSHRVLVIDDCARRGDWEGVLREAKGLPLVNYTDVVSQHVNRALFETRRLGEEMFAYPQNSRSIVVDLDMGKTPEEQGRKMHRRTDLWFQLGDLDLRLGLVNETEHEAHEALALHGPHPEILNRLALVNLIKRQPGAARVFLEALSLHPIRGSEAKAVLHRMEGDPYVSSDLLIRSVRSVMLKRDRQFKWESLEARCLGLLEDNPHNRMAFEYLMACYLLRRDLSAFARELPRLRQLGYTAMPRHYQEAVLLCEGAAPGKQQRLGYDISAKVLQSFAEFAQALRTPNQTPRTLASRFGDTYFFYYAFGATGAMAGS